jgi:hypothetical protein
MEAPMAPDRNPSKAPTTVQVETAAATFDKLSTPMPLHADDPHIVVLVEQVFAHVAPDGSLAPDQGSQPKRVRRRPRFDADARR